MRFTIDVDPAEVTPQEFRAVWKYLDSRGTDEFVFGLAKFVTEVQAAKNGQIENMQAAEIAELQELLKPVTHTVSNPPTTNYPHETELRDKGQWVGPPTGF